MNNIYKIAGDTHTHTVSCGHAYSTISENARAAYEKGHFFLITTEHTETVAGAPGRTFFKNLPRTVPRVLNNVLMLYGCEVNILPDSSLDLVQSVLDSLDWVIASIHKRIVPENMSADKYTEMWFKAMENPAVDCLGHIGTPEFACDYEAVVQNAAKTNKIIEINSASFVVREGSAPNCKRVAELCMKYNVPVVLSSDAHFCTRIGDVYEGTKVLSELRFPPELVLNTNYNKIKRYITNKRGTQLPSVVELMQMCRNEET